jgi:hypothetical protein
VSVSELVGRVIDRSTPALTIGAVLGRGLTITATSSNAVAPELSVTVNRKIEVVAVVRPVIEVVAEDGDAMVPCPLIFVHAYDEMLPSVSEPDPASDTVVVGSVINLSAPAFAVGGLFGDAFTTTSTSSNALAPPLSITDSRNVEVP